MGKILTIISISQAKRIYETHVIPELEKIRMCTIKNRDKELIPEYTISSFSFDQFSRIAKIEITIKQSYRTIEKYVTRNYVKYPVYSEWKLKVKKIQKTVKLNNEELENLNNNCDELLRYFSDEIIIRLNDEKLFPRWFQAKYFILKTQEQIKLLQKKQNEIYSIYNDKNNICYSIINKNSDEIRILKKQKVILDKKIGKLKFKLEKISNTKITFFLLIITFGICKYYYGSKRQSKIIEILNNKENKLKSILATINDLDTINNECFIEISHNNEISKKKINDINAEINREKIKIQNAFEYTNPLKEVELDKEFVSLKELQGIDYRKIIGCYIIWNKEKDKYYIGQSKDVIKRLKQHFNGTIPKNIIFAEDYFNSNMSNRDDIFYFKIIPLSSKAELDEKERELIEKYDSFQHGYNGTNGNS